MNRACANRPSNCCIPWPKFVRLIVALAASVAQAKLNIVATTADLGAIAKEIGGDKIELTTLGKPGVQVAVLTRRPQGYFITHVEGAKRPTVNGQEIGAAPHSLKDHDVIELAGIKMEFFLKA